MKKRVLMSMSVVILGALPDIVVSCPVCFGDKSSAEVEGARWAIVFLLGVTGTVLSGVLTFAIYLRRRARLNLRKQN